MSAPGLLQLVRFYVCFSIYIFTGDEMIYAEKRTSCNKPAASGGNLGGAGGGGATASPPPSRKIDGFSEILT